MGTFIILLLTGGTATVAILSVFANIIGHETQLHDLRNRVKDLQYRHLLYLAKQDGRIPDPTDQSGGASLALDSLGSVEILDDEHPDVLSDPPTPISAQAA